MFLTFVATFVGSQFPCKELQTLILENCSALEGTSPEFWEIIKTKGSEYAGVLNIRGFT